MDIKVYVFIGISLDGFIARKDGAIDFLDGHEEPEPGQDYGYAAHWERIDTLVLGRHSFETVISFGQWPYEGRRVVVLSSGQPLVPPDLQGKIEILSGPVAEVVQKMADTGSRHIYVDGGKTVQAFLRAGLVSELIITILPVLIGEGIPLFGPLGGDLKLELLEARSFENGFVQLKYRPRAKRVSDQNAAGSL